MEHGKKTTERRCSLLILSLAILFILVIVVGGICVHFLVEGNTSKVILLGLIGLLIIVGIVSFAFLECLRRADMRKTEVIVTDQRQKMYETAPTISGKSWAYSTPWRYSKGSTIRAE